MHHDAELSGHFGFTRTLARISDRYFWPSMRKDCKKYVTSCSLCQAHKSKAPNAISHTLHPNLPEGPNFRIHIDLIGPLPLTERQNTYCLVMVDAFTKWGVAVPILSKEGGEVAEAIYKKWICNYGIPYEFYSDQGKEFCNDLNARILERLTVGHKVSSPYYPQSNGEVERFNSTLKKSLAIYAEEHAGTWDQFPDSVVWAYNSSLNPQTGFSPYFLMFGRDPRLPTDVWTGSYKDIKHDVTQYSTNLTLHMREAFEIVKKNLVANAIKMKTVWDSKLKSHHKFNGGDEVLLYQPQLNSQADQLEHAQVWTRKWLGPYKIVGQTHKDNCDVYTLRDTVTEREWTVNVHRLRPYYGRTNLLTAESEETCEPAGVRPDVGVPPAEQLLDSARSNSVAAADATIPRRNHQGHTSTRTTKSKGHRDSTRHKTGITAQEHKKARKRQEWDETNDDPDSSEFKEYDIEKIISHRKVARTYQYQVKWANYDEQTWEPERSFCTQNILKEYWAAFSPKQRPRKYRK